MKDNNLNIFYAKNNDKEDKNDDEIAVDNNINKNKFADYMLDK